MAKSNGTNYFIVDTSSILRTEDLFQKIIKTSGHILVIISSVIDELDSFKKGSDQLNKMARTAIDWIDENFNSVPEKPIAVKGYPGNLMLKNFVFPIGERTTDLNLEKADHQIIWVAMELKKSYPKAVVTVVSEDKNLRVRAKLCGLEALSYIRKENQDGGFKESAFSIKTIKVGDNILSSYYLDKGSGIPRGKVSYVGKPLPNQGVFLGLRDKKIPFIYDQEGNCFREVDIQSTIAQIKPRNDEQGFLFSSLMDPNIRLVVVQGISGSGKTLLSMAAAIEQKSLYHNIYVTRPIIPLNNKDIGYLPGDQNQKVDPFMQPLWDNLDLIIASHSDKSAQNIIRGLKNDQNKGKSSVKGKESDPKMVIQPLAYLRGRSLGKVFFIIDEAQNLTPLEVKTIVTRAGENTKIVFTGDVNQIDTPYLDHGSNGLSHLVSRLVSNPNAHAAVHILQKGERSELANWGNEFL